MKPFVVLLALSLTACPRGGDKPKPAGHIEPAAPDEAGVTELASAPALPTVPVGLPALAPDPRVTAEAVALGEQLFFDPRLAAAIGRARPVTIQLTAERPAKSQR